MIEFKGYLRGVNLGGWYSQCNHTKERYDNFIKKDDFKRISKWGLDHVRLPIDYNLIQNDDASFKEDGFKRIDVAINWAKENNLNIILDLHKTMGYCFDSFENESGFFESDTLQNNFYNVWEEFSKRFAKYNNVAFELLNEVTDLKYKDKWNAIIKETIKRIRVNAPSTSIIVGGCLYANPGCVKYLEIPADDNIVFTFHSYDPLIFTHQGAWWVENMDVNFRMNFSDSIDLYNAYNKKYTGRDYLTIKNVSKIDETYFVSLFEEAIEICDKNNIPLYCGEYGVIDLVEPNETLKWFKCISNVFNEYKIGRAVWNYKEKDFGLVDAHYDEIRKELIELL